MFAIEDAESWGDKKPHSLASIVAINLVNQVIDEARVIANALREAGETWTFSLSILSNLNDISYKQDTFTDMLSKSKVENYSNVYKTCNEIDIKKENNNVDDTKNSEDSWDIFCSAKGNQPKTDHDDGNNLIDIMDIPIYENYTDVSCPTEIEDVLKFYKNCSDNQEENNIDDLIINLNSKSFTGLSYPSKEVCSVVHKNCIECVEKEENNIVDFLFTSTPEKPPNININEGLKSSDKTRALQNEEPSDVSQNLQCESTSVMINKLFDMSVVEPVVCNELNLLHFESNDEELLNQATEKVMESRLNTVLKNDNIGNVSEDLENTAENANQTVVLSFTNPVDINIDNNVTFSAECNVKRSLDESVSDNCNIPQNFKDEVNNETEEDVETKNGIDLYEKTYLTLNRDYDQSSDDNNYAVGFQDTKGITLQEIDLLTGRSTDVDLSVESKLNQHQELAAETGVLASRTSKKSLMNRWRSHGARFLACLRGWWRRKQPGKRKESRHPGAARGMSLCPMNPLSPTTRRRSSSLLNQLRSPSPSRSALWKFNTINEALVNTPQYKDYTFETMTDVCGEHF